MSSETITTEIRYLKRLELYNTEKPFQIFFDIPDNEPDQRPDNLEFEGCQHQVCDIRPQLDSFTLDDHGFKVQTQVTSLSLDDFSDREVVENVYLPEVEQILRREDSTIDKIFFFDWRLRSGAMATSTQEGRIDLNDLTAWLHPARAVHIDQSPRAVLHRVELHLAAEAEFLLKGRVRVINAWRPLIDTVEDWPLAVCDATTMPDEDLIECDQVRRNFIGNTMYGLTSTKHKWYYLHHQRPDEVLLLKMFDSSDNVKAKRCPHASFKHPNCRSDVPTRRSIEVRALIFNYLPSEQGL